MFIEYKHWDLLPVENTIQGHSSKQERQTKSPSHVSKLKTVIFLKQKRHSP